VVTCSCWAEMQDIAASEAPVAGSRRCVGTGCVVPCQPAAKAPSLTCLFDGCNCDRQLPDVSWKALHVPTMYLPGLPSLLCPPFLSPVPQLYALASTVSVLPCADPSVPHAPVVYADCTWIGCWRTS
jgi:hypothetical protein